MRWRKAGLLVLVAVLLALPALADGMTYILTIANPVGVGTTSPSPGQYEFSAGAVVTLNAFPNYKNGVQNTAFVRWEILIGEDWQPYSTSASTTITMDGDKTVRAVFEVIYYTLATGVTPPGSGSVSGAGSYEAGDYAQVQAVPGTGWSFSHWSGDLSGTDNPAQILMNGHKTVVANFTTARHTLTVTVSPEGAGTVGFNPLPGQDGKYEYGTVVTLTPNPAQGYIFDSWGGTNANNVYQENGAYKILINGNKVLVANFLRLYDAQRSFPTVWNLLSVPLKPVPDTPAAVFGDDVSPLFIYWWNPDTGQYVTPTTIDPGRGYWVYILYEGTMIDLTGILIDTDYEVQLGKSGWHMISTPTVPVYWGWVKFRLGSDTKELEDAVAAGWVSPFAFRWDPATEKYLQLGVADTIQPWFGYWIRTYEDNLTVILPVYEAIHNPPPAPSPLSVTAATAPMTPPPPPTLPMADKSGLAVLNYPNPVRDVHTTRFIVMNAGVEAIRVSIYDLSGRLVWRNEAVGNELVWHTDDFTGQFLANGVYLYVVEAKIQGTWVRSEVRKLVILR